MIVQPSGKPCLGCNERTYGKGPRARYSSVQMAEPCVLPPRASTVGSGRLLLEAVGSPPKWDGLLAKRLS